MVESDKGFIFSTWIKEQWLTHPLTSCPPEFYLPHQRQIITTLLELPAKCLIACAPDNADMILGYIVYEMVADILVLHWAHRKDIYRNMGLGKDIIKQVYPDIGVKPIMMTQNNRMFNKLKHKWMLAYNPFYITDRLIQCS
jgi:hypothetical protein